VPVAFIGAVLKDTPTIVTPTGVAGLKFLDEADAINSYVPELKAMGVHAIVVNIHQGGTQTSYTGPTRSNVTVSGAPILDIINRLDDEIDVVVSGHSHAFSNALVANKNGTKILVTQAFSASTASADIDLLIDPVTGQVTSKTASVVTTFSDVAPGTTRDPAVNSVVMAAQAIVRPLVNRVVGEALAELPQAQNAAGESAIGDLIADAQRAATAAEFTFMNPGGIRAGLNAGPILWGELFTIQPFGNSLVTMNLTGAQVYAVLEQQWAGQPFPRIMQISGFDYTWDPAKPVGSRVLEVRKGGVAIDKTATYTVSCNNFMATGGDNFTVFTGGTNQVGGAIDLDALVDYVEDHTPIAGGIAGRIKNP
jgi:5'-nucleotidase